MAALHFVEDSGPWTVIFAVAFPALLFINPVNLAVWVSVPQVFKLFGSQSGNWCVQSKAFCVGNSLGICGVDPMELYKNHGYTSYNIGCEMQMPVETYYTIRTALKKQPVKVILWEANNISKHHKNLDAYISRLAEALRYRFPCLRYHYVWKNRIDDYRQRKYFKGFVVNEVTDPYTGEYYYDFDDPHTDVFAKEQYYYFRKIKKLCDDNGIKLVLYGVPSPVSYNVRMHRGIVKLAEENGVDFLDGNNDLEGVGIDWNEDTFDRGDHLNLSGSVKLTEYLAAYLEKECSLTDHRNDPAYQSWEELLPAYEQEVRDMEGTSYPRLEKERRERKVRRRRKAPEEMDAHAIQSRQIRK